MEKNECSMSGTQGMYSGNSGVENKRSSISKMSSSAPGSAKVQELSDKALHSGTSKISSEMNLKIESIQDLT